jgi:hypothetical protein
MGQPTQGQCFFYYGDDIEKFARVFAAIGLLVVPYCPPLAQAETGTEHREAEIDPEALADVIGQVGRVHAENDTAAEPTAAMARAAV